MTTSLAQNVLKKFARLEWLPNLCKHFPSILVVIYSPVVVWIVLFDKGCDFYLSPNWVPGADHEFPPTLNEIVWSQGGNFFIAPQSRTLRKCLCPGAHKHFLRVRSYDAIFMEFLDTRANCQTVTPWKKQTNPVSWCENFVGEISESFDLHHHRISNNTPYSLLFLSWGWNNFQS